MGPPTSNLDWLYHLIGWTLAAAGLLLLLWALFWDRGRRRCPKCWYDMSGFSTADCVCPECGRVASRSGQLLRTRRRYKFASLAVLLILVPAAARLVDLVQSRQVWNHLPNTVLIWSIGRFESDEPSLALQRIVERGDGFVGWLDRSALRHWQWKFLESRVNTCLKSTPRSSRRGEDIQRARGLIGEFPVAAIDRRFIPRRLLAPERVIEALAAEGTAALERIRGMECEPDPDRDHESLSAIVLPGPLPADVDTVIDVEHGNSHTLLSLARHSDDWWLVGLLTVEDHYGDASPTLFEHADQVFIRAHAAVMWGSGVYAADEVWYSIPAGEEVARFRTRGHLNGCPTWADNSYTGRFIAHPRGTTGRAFEVEMTMDYEPNYWHFYGRPKDDPLFDITGTMFIRRWMDRFEWDDKEAAYTWRASTPLDGSKSDHGRARLQPDFGDHTLSRLVEFNFDVIEATAPHNQTLRIWGRAAAMELKGTSVGNKLELLLRDLPNP